MCPPPVKTILEWKGDEKQFGVYVPLLCGRTERVLVPADDVFVINLLVLNQ